MQKGILTNNEGQAGFEVIGDGDLARRAIQRDRSAETRLRERRILNLLESSGGQMSFADIGRRLGISRERVRAIARGAGSDARRASVASRPELTCPQCGRVFTARPYQIRAGRGFCSSECYHASQRDPGAPRVELVCEVCGKTYTRMEYQLRGRRSRFCSRVCHGRWLSGLKQPQRPQKKAKKEERQREYSVAGASSAEGYVLTLRRRQLLEHIAAGDSYEETARALGIKERTVRNEMHTLMRRMGARNRAHAVAKWLAGSQVESDLTVAVS